MPDLIEDLNNVVVSGLLAKPIDFAEPVSFLELKIRRGLGVCFISVHAGPDLRRDLYALGVGDQLLIRGQLAYAKTDRLAGGGQHCIKAASIEPMDAKGRVQRRVAPAVSAEPPKGGR